MIESQGVAGSQLKKKKKKPGYHIGEYEDGASEV